MNLKKRAGNESLHRMRKKPRPRKGLGIPLTVLNTNKLNIGKRGWFVKGRSLHYRALEVLPAGLSNAYYSGGREGIGNG